MIDPRSIEGSPERAALPPRGAPWHEIEAWCATIAGPAGDPRPIDELASIAHRVQAGMGAADIGSLLAAAYLA